MNNQDKNDHDLEGLFENMGYVPETPEHPTSPIGSSNSFSRSRSLSRSTRSPGSPSLSGSIYNSSRSSSSSSNVSVPTTQSKQVTYDLLQKKIQSLEEEEKKNQKKKEDTLAKMKQLKIAPQQTSKTKFKKADKKIQALKCPVCSIS